MTVKVRILSNFYGGTNNPTFRRWYIKGTVVPMEEKMAHQMAEKELVKVLDMPPQATAGPQELEKKAKKTTTTKKKRKPRKKAK